MKFLLAILVFLLMPGAGTLHAGDPEKMRGDRVGWARLKTPSLYWDRHALRDSVLTHFLRENTSLDIDPTWYVADVENLGELCKYPIIFSQGVDMIRGETGKANLAEYVRRGGFLLIDACINKKVTPDPDVFLEDQMRFLTTVLPEAHVVPLTSQHDIFRCYFQIPNGTPPHIYDGDIYDPQWAKHGLYAIVIGSRTAGVISLSGLQCGWARDIAPTGVQEACMRMVINIYTYAMLQGN